MSAKGTIRVGLVACCLSVPLSGCTGLSNTEQRTATGTLGGAAGGAAGRDRRQCWARRYRRSGRGTDRWLPVRPVQAGAGLRLSTGTQRWPREPLATEYRIAAAREEIRVGVGRSAISRIRFGRDPPDQAPPARNAARTSRLPTARPRQAHPAPRRDASPRG